MLGPLFNDTLCDVLILTTIMCLCKKVYKPFNFTDSKEQECISLGELLFQIVLVQPLEFPFHSFYLSIMPQH